MHRGDVTDRKRHEAEERASRQENLPALNLDVGEILNLDVGEIITRVNRMLVSDLDENHFVTLILAHIDAASLGLRYASAGHVPGFIIGGAPGRGGRVTMDSTGPPMGLFANAVFPSRQLPLEMDQSVLLVTDGVTESAGEDDEQFGTDRLVAYADERAGRSARSLAYGICDVARRFAGKAPQVDDVTAVVAKVTAAEELRGDTVH